MEWSWNWFSFLVGLFVGANAGLLMFAMLKNSTQGKSDE